MQCSRPGLILQQQPACLLTALWGFTAAQMPWGHLVWPQLSLSVCLSSMPPVLCDHVRNNTIQYSHANIRLGFPINKEVMPQSMEAVYFFNTGITVWLRSILLLQLWFDSPFKFSIWIYIFFALIWCAICISDRNTTQWNFTVHFGIFFREKSLTNLTESHLALSGGILDSASLMEKSVVKLRQF